MPCYLLTGREGKVHSLLLKLLMLQLHLPLSFLKVMLSLVQLSISHPAEEMPSAAPCQTQPCILVQSWIIQVHASLLETGLHLLMYLAKCTGHPAAPHGQVVCLCLKVGEHAFKPLRYLCICVTELTQFLQRVNSDL